MVGSAASSRGKPPKPRITVSYQEADIRDVIAAFASFANRTIIVGRDVTGSITADVKDKPWDEALAAILSAQGLAASEEPNGIIIVDSYKNMLDKQSLEPLVTQVVSINYANASSVAGTVRGLLTRDCVPGAGSPASGGGGASLAPGSVPSGCVVRGSVQADSATNSLLIREVQSRMEDVISYVRSIDRRTPQVAIKAKIIFVNRSSLQELGITYDIGTARQFFNTVIPRQEVVQQIPIDRNGDGVPDAFREVLQPVIGDRVDLGGKTLSAIANANSSISSPALNLIFSAALGKYSLTPFIQALQESSLADVQAEPTVVTLDNRKAEILVGQEIPIRVLDAGAGARRRCAGADQHPAGHGAAEGSRHLPLGHPAYHEQPADHDDDPCREQLSVAGQLGCRVHLRQAARRQHADGAGWRDGSDRRSHDHAGDQVAPRCAVPDGPAVPRSPVLDDQKE